MYDNGVFRKCVLLCLFYIMDLFIIYNNKLKYCLNNIDGCSYFKVILIFLKKR